MKFLKFWEWLKNLFDDCLPPSHKPPPPPDLCEDVIIHILLRVQPEVLSRFKCVNRKYCRLINDPDFLYEYRSRLPYRPPPLRLFYYPHSSSTHIGFSSVKLSRDKKHRKAIQTIDKSLSFLPNPVQILSSSHGLILYISTEPYPGGYCVCNPITKQHIMLPKSRGPSDLPFIGFFVNPKFGTYHVVRIPALVARDTFAFIETFSSETGKWKLSKLVFPFPYCLLSPFWPAVQWNGSLHWVDRLGSILAYNVTEEKFRFLDIPTMVLGDQRLVVPSGVLGVFGGFLSDVYCESDVLEVWVSKEENWVQVRRVSVCLLVRQNMEVWRRLGVKVETESVSVRPSMFLTAVCFDESDSGVVFVKVPGCILSYHFEQGKIEAIQHLPKGEYINVVFPYVVPQLPFPVEIHSQCKTPQTQ